MKLIVVEQHDPGLDDDSLRYVVRLALNVLEPHVGVALTATVAEALIAVGIKVVIVRPDM